MLKFVDHNPITRPRSRLWNQPAIVPTLPDHPVACARPLIATSAVIARQSFANPIAIVTTIDTAMPTSTLRRGPSLVPIHDATN